MVDTAKEPTKTKKDPPVDGADSSLTVDDPPVYEFNDPDLKGKSPKEIEEIFRMSKSIVEGQKKKLDTARTTIDRLQTEPSKKVEPTGDKKGFFDDPDGALLRLEKRLEDQITPLRQELQIARGELKSQGVFDKLREEFDDWDQVYPWIRNMIDSQDPPYPAPNDEGLLRTLYFTALGAMYKKGVLPTKEPVVDVTDGGEPKRAAPPQHRSSPPPPAPKKKADGENEDTIFAEFDETEKSLCRYYKMKPSDFRDMQNEEPDEVVTSKIGLKEKEA